MSKESKNRVMSWLQTPSFFILVTGVALVMGMFLDLVREMIGWPMLVSTLVLVAVLAGVVDWLVVYYYAG